MSYSLVYICILNWNGWKDTIECLESVFRLDYDNYRVIVCDNNSADGSLEYIKAWAEGRLDVYLPQDNPLRRLSFPPVSKPIPYCNHDRKDAENGDKKDCESKLILIQTGDNLGFAGGNNVGMRYALARNDFEFLWLLNNDTVILPDSLFYMANKLKCDTRTGICGSKIAYYHDDSHVQTLGGGRYNKWLGITRHIDAFQETDKNNDETLVVSKMDYVMGASMLVTSNFLFQIGLMCEDYFLYFEELDWAQRSKGLYLMTYADKSLIYHKEGATLGSSSIMANKSFISEYYGVKSKLIFSKKYYIYLSPCVYFAVILSFAKRLFKREYKKAILIINAMLFDYTENDLKRLKAYDKKKY